MQEISAGILVYRKNRYNEIEVLLGKPGGPYWKNRNVGVWNIPKGHITPSENLLDCAVREFVEETGLIITPEDKTKLLYIGSAKTSQNKKIVHIYVFEHDYNEGSTIVPISSNMCETEFPAGSGNIISVPELSEAKYIPINKAKDLIFSYQKVFLERLENVQ